MSDYYRSLAWALWASGDVMGLRISNTQIVLLQGLLERELEHDPLNPEWPVLLDRLERMRAWRERGWPEKPYPEPEVKVWGRDYE